jgi:hypothetical protein
MAKQIQFTDLHGAILVLKKNEDNTIRITVAETAQDLIDNNFTFYELEIEDLENLVYMLRILKKEIDININGSNRIAPPINDEDF